MAALSRERAEQILHWPIDESLWRWIVKNNRQQEILDSPKYERGEFRNWGSPRVRPTTQ